MLTIERLKEVVTYDPGTGIFTRNYGVRGSAKGDFVGSIRKRDGYVTISVDGKAYLAHRLAWFYMTGKWPKPYADHKNGNPTDNGWENIREATQTQQNANTGRRKDNSSGLRGISWCRRPKGWRARICVNGVRTLLGIFADIDDAKWVYEAAAKKYFGEFARPQ